MTLSRRDLEENRMRSVYVEALSGHHALTDEQLSASLTDILKKRPKGAGCGRCRAARCPTPA